METISRILEKRYLESKAKSPHYSLRAMAKRLGISSGALSEILKGKRKVSPKLTAKLAEKLALSPSERRELGLKGVESNHEEFLLSEDSFHLISDWWHFGILNLTQTEGFRFDAGWISRRLGLSKFKIENAIDRLLRLGLLAQDKNGRLTRTHAKMKTVDNILNLAIQRSHRIDLELIAHCLEEVPVALRDTTSATMTVSPRSLPKLKELIRRFEDELMEEAESVKGSEVYRLSISFFPLTQTQKGNA